MNRFDSKRHKIIRSSLSRPTMIYRLRLILLLLTWMWRHNTISLIGRLKVSHIQLAVRSCRLSDRQLHTNLATTLNAVRNLLLWGNPNSKPQSHGETSLGGSLIVVRQWHCCEVAILLLGINIVVRQPHCCEAASLLWGSLIVVRQPYCCEAASLLWGTLIVVRQPQCCEAASMMWGTLIVLRQPHCCEAASLMWGSLIAVR